MQFAVRKLHMVYPVVELALGDVTARITKGALMSTITKQ